MLSGGEDEEGLTGQGPDVGGEREGETLLVGEGGGEGKRDAGLHWEYH